MLKLVQQRVMEGSPLIDTEHVTSAQKEPVFTARLF